MTTRRPGRPKVDQSKLRYALELYQGTEMTVPEICRKAGVSRTSLYRFIEQQKGAC